jgi:hypothetical protein
MTIDRMPALTIALLLGWSVPLAAALPERFSALYLVEAMGTTVARSEWTLAPLGGDRWAYETRTAPTGVFALLRPGEIVERSEWRREGDRVRPLHYRYDRSGRRERHVEVVFDWPAGEARNTASGESWRMEIPDRTLDKLSYMLVLMEDLSAGRTDLRYTVADGGHLKDYHLEIAGEERIDTAVGSLRTLRIVRMRAERSERETTIWVAPELGFLPVRVQHREPDGEVVVLRIDQVEGLGPRADTGPPAQAAPDAAVTVSGPPPAVAAGALAGG